MDYLVFFFNNKINISKFNCGHKFWYVLKNFCHVISQLNFILFSIFNIYHVLYILWWDWWSNEIMKYGVQVLQDWEEEGKRRNLRIQEGTNGALSWAGTGGGSMGGRGLRIYRWQDSVQWVSLPPWGDYLERPDLYLFPVEISSAWTRSTWAHLSAAAALCSQHSMKSSCYNEMFVRHQHLNGSQYHYL